MYLKKLFTIFIIINDQLQTKHEKLLEINNFVKEIKEEFDIINNMLHNNGKKLLTFYN